MLEISSPRSEATLNDAGVLVGALAIQQSQAGEGHPVQNLKHRFALKRAAFVFAQVQAVVVFRGHLLVADRALALLVIALHRDLGDDPLADQLVGQLRVRAVGDVKLARALDAPAAGLLDEVRRHDAAHDVGKILRVLQIDLLVDRRLVARRQFLGREVIAVLVGAAAAEHEAELRVTSIPGPIERRGVQGSGRGRNQIHGDRGVARRRGTPCGRSGSRPGPGRDE